jgi:hypothetical protein
MKTMGNKNKAMVFLSLFFAGIMVVPFIASCGKGGGVSPAGSRIAMQVVNLSPDLQPINLWVGYRQQNNYAFSYPNASGYFSLTSIDTPIQIRSGSQLGASTNFITRKDILKPNVRYTLFVTGLRFDTTTTDRVTSILTVDTTSNPSPGRGKIRFVNASPRSSSFDVAANGSIAFLDAKYKSVSPFIEIPPGIYEFKVMPNKSATVISSLRNISILEGKVYTLYCRGVAGGADSVAFGAGIISNR